MSIAFQSNPVLGARVSKTVASLALAAMALAVPAFAGPTGLELVEEYRAPGLEMELSGIYPHPTQAHHYFAVANRNPVYQPGQTPLLDADYRGKLLTVDGRTGEVKAAFDLVDGEYGDIAFGNGELFVSSLEPAEVLRVDPETGAILGRIPLAGPAGGLEFDAERSLLVAQIFTGHPHLAVIDPATGSTVDTLWSDESAMGLAKVNGDLLCTWASRFDEHTYSELRLLDPETGKVQGRLALEGVHTSMAPVVASKGQRAGFLAMVSDDRQSGQVTLRRYAYDANGVEWRR